LPDPRFLGQAKVSDPRWSGLASLVDPLWLGLASMPYQTQGAYVWKPR
jgi:hypothetical protein